MDLNKIKKIYIIGIEGAGTSALARMLKSMGIDVTGSDEGDHYYYDALRDDGIRVFHEFNQDNIPDDAQAIIYSTSLKPETNIELRDALDSGKKVYKYPEALGELSRQKHSIAVCGTHGKTTTSAWLAYVMEESGLSPNAIIGSKVPQLGGGVLIGSSDYLIFEADEYQNKFEYYFPKAIVLNNIEFDHPDFFESEDHCLLTFVNFIEKLSSKGFLVANFDDSNIEKIAKVNTKARVISYAINNNEVDYQAYDIKVENDRQFFKVKLNSDGEEDDLGDFSIQLSGRHNISNALAVIVTAIELEIDLRDIRTHLEEFQGASRRMEIMGEHKGALIINDYAHHPTEIRATLEGVKAKYKNQRIIAVFQPHTFTRTIGLLDQFAACFKDADEIIITDIHGSAREKQGGIHSQDLVDEIRKHTTANSNQELRYIGALEECRDYLMNNISRGDIVLLLGAGDIYTIGYDLVK